VSEATPSAGDPGPYLELAVLCERVLEERDGVLSLVRLVDRLEVTVPGPAGAAGPAALAPVQLFAVVGFKSGQARGRHQLRLTLERPACAGCWPSCRCCSTERTGAREQLWGSGSRSNSRDCTGSTFSWTSGGSRGCRCGSSTLHIGQADHGAATDGRRGAGPGPDSGRLRFNRDRTQPGCGQLAKLLLGAMPLRRLGEPEEDVSGKVGRGPGAARGLPREGERFVFEALEREFSKREGYQQLEQLVVPGG